MSVVGGFFQTSVPGPAETVNAAIFEGGCASEGGGE